MTTVLQISINFSTFHNPHDDLSKNRSFCGLKVSPLVDCNSLSRAKVVSFHQNGYELGVPKEGLSYLGLSGGKGGILVGGEWKRKKRMVVVRFNQGFGFDGGSGSGGGGGGGGRDNSNTARLLVNLALAIGLTYLSMTGQLGWVLDAIVSVWLIAVLLPIVGLGAFLWWAGRDIVQGTCPNCGNDFQIFKSTLNEDLQLCPFCSQPFSVVDNEFVSDPVKFTNKSTTFGEAFSDFSSHPKKGKDSSIAIVDVEAEIKDAD